METTTVKGIYGLMAEFSDPEEIVIAARKTHEAGYTAVEAYTPFPVHGLHEAIGFEDNRQPWVIFVAGLVGATFGFGLQSWVAAVDNNFNSGGRPYISWPSFIPITFECTVLFAALTAAGTMLAFNGLPRPHHSVFNAPRFSMASNDRFMLCIEATDPSFDEEATREFLVSLGPSHVTSVER